MTEACKKKKNCKEYRNKIDSKRIVTKLKHIIWLSSYIINTTMLR